MTDDDDEVSGLDDELPPWAEEDTDDIPQESDELANLPDDVGPSQ
ncbi:MAG TPA: hypothetical protein VH371_12275 [Candidatus Limnocylindrales bacterium]|jgi:hypothetical protein